MASALLPRRMRHHVAAVYAFARVADDFADEESRPADIRAALLDGWHNRLRAAVSGEETPVAVPGEPAEAREIFHALGATIRELGLPLTLFEDLLSAFRQDITVCRYETWSELLDYCRRSANPVGRLVLRIAGYADARLDMHSDAICTALQLTNFWQDLRPDFDRGRIYLPREESRAHDAEEARLGEARLPPEWRAAVAAAATRTRVFFDAGRPLCDAVRGRLRYELRATWLGGTRVLDRLHDSNFDPVALRPRLRAADAPWLAWKLVTWA